MSKFTSIRIVIAALVFAGAVIVVNNTRKSNNNLPKTASSTQEQTSSQVKGDQVTNQESSNGASQIKVKRVVDGDTIELEDGQKVRYIGINTPETVDPRKPVECFGREASDYNKKLVEGKSISLIKDVSETDKYGRLLRYVYVDNIFVNDNLVRQGFAYSSSYPPDIKYQNQFQQAQEEAQSQNRGLWSNCPYGGSSPSAAGQVSSQNLGCDIKGNISSSGEKIYHMPTQRYYNSTVIDQSKGERWFCTEQDAISAGWRKSKI